jgi:hypothetical protein
MGSATFALMICEFRFPARTFYLDECAAEWSKGNLEFNVKTWRIAWFVPIGYWVSKRIE